MRRPAFWILVFAFAACVFGWETYRAWTTAPMPADPPASGFAVPSRAGAIGDNASRGADPGLLVAVIAARPLFRPGREPFHENAAAVMQRNYDAELAAFSLIGVLLQGDTRKGIVLGTAPGARNRWEVAPGDSLPGFTVKDVQADALVVTADGKEFLVPLYAGGPKGQPAGSLRTEAATAPAPGQGPGAAPVPPAPQPASTPLATTFPPATAPQEPAGPFGSPFGIRTPSRPPRTYPGQR